MNPDIPHGFLCEETGSGRTCYWCGLLPGGKIHEPTSWQRLGQLVMSILRPRIYLHNGCVIRG